MKDILENLNKMPYNVPEGYFETFEEKVRPWEKRNGGVVRKLLPYMSMAAMFAIIAVAGTSILRVSAREDELQEYADIFYYGPGPATESVYDFYESDNNSLTEDDIIEYLIYSDTGTGYIAYND